MNMLSDLTGSKFNATCKSNIQQLTSQSKLKVIHHNNSRNRIMVMAISFKEN